LHPTIRIKKNNMKSLKLINFKVSLTKINILRGFQGELPKKNARSV
jgi:hypothetical protein